MQDAGESYGTSVDTRKIQLPINLRLQPPPRVSLRDLSDGSFLVVGSFPQLKLTAFL